MSTFDRLADLPLEIESYDLEPLEYQVRSDFTRHTTVIRLKGGDEGVGEDVTYGTPEQQAFQKAGPVLNLAGSHTLRSFSEKIGELDLFPKKPEQDAYRFYRRWAFESAALDLALRQAKTSLVEALNRKPKPVRFVASLGLGKPPTFDPLAKRIKAYPKLRYKIDPTPEWSEALVGRVADSGRIETIDLKGWYRGTTVDVKADPAFYQRILDAFPQAWIEDPFVDEETRAVLNPHAGRITWDAPVHSRSDFEQMPYRAKMTNIKPSRFGSLEALFEMYDYCSAEGIDIYGGGQFELGPGRGQIQYLASIFHPDTPNDVAPRGYNETELSPDLPTSPLAPRTLDTGFRWQD